MAQLRLRILSVLRVGQQRALVLEGPEGEVRIPVPSIEIIQNPSPNMKRGKIPSFEAVVP